MSKPAAQAVHLGKQYRIGGIQDDDETLGEALAEAVRWPVRAARAMAHGENPFRAAQNNNLIWALKDVSFDVPQGQVMGIIGRNGAGKSTLLKILTRITNPTEGFAKIRGRVGSLLEVGTGFHPELTGRENVYMSGAVLGMRRAEIDQKFDEIVAFSGVERFIDTPVKRYSSGMYLRLAFSVSAHLEPDVLLVDEVLAVGDAEFQKKCLGKLGGVAQEGRTVLFVSHNMNAIKHLCDTAIWLEEGRIKMVGEAEDVVGDYLAGVKEQAADQRSVFPAVNAAYGVGFDTCQATIHQNADNGSTDLRLELVITSTHPLPRIGIGFGLTTDTGIRVVSLGPRLTNYMFDMEPGKNRFCLEVPNINRVLAAGDYIVSLWLSMPSAERLVMIDQAALITLPGVDMFGTGRLVDARKHGLALVPLTIRREM